MNLKDEQGGFQTESKRQMTSVPHRLRSILMVLCSLFCSCATGGVRTDLSPGETSVQGAVTLEFVRTIGSPGNGPGQMLNPLGLSVDPQGNLYVADTGNDRIQKFDDDGNYLTEVGGFGFDPEQFNEPRDVCATAGLNIYVVDSQNRRLQRFDRQLHYLSAVLTNPNLEASLQFDIPAGVSVSSTGDIFITDAQNERVLKLDPFERPDRSFGDTGYGQGLLRNPTSLAIGPDDIIHVCDTGNDRIALYDLYGEYRQSIGQTVLRTPHGVVVDPHGNIYVADTGNDRVVIFDRQGELLFTFGTPGTATGSFRSPHDVAIDRNGSLYVLDTNNSRVQKFNVLSR